MGNLLAGFYPHSDNIGNSNPSPSSPKSTVRKLPSFNRPAYFPEVCQANVNTEEAMVDGTKLNVTVNVYILVHTVKFRVNFMHVIEAKVS